MLMLRKGGLCIYAYTDSRMRQSRILLALIIALALVSIGLAWLLPVPARFFGSPDEFRAAFGVANFSNVLSIGTAALFLIGLNGFKQELKTAYYLICAGLFTQVGGTAIYSIRTYIHPVERNLIGDLPITIGALLMFVGIWWLARTLKVQGRIFGHPATISGVLLLASTVLWVLPHGTYHLETHLVHANHVLEALFYPLACVLLWRIIRTTSHSYAHSFTWMLVAVAGNFVAAGLFLGGTYVTYPAWATYELLGALFIVDTIIYVIAGYSFATLQQRMSRRQTASSPIDIILFVASLASRQKDIDPILDHLRVFTASTPGAYNLLTPEQDKQLAGIYYQLEDYLITKEPLRSFTRESIRALVQRKFERLPVGVPLTG